MLIVRMLRDGAACNMSFPMGIRVQITRMSPFSVLVQLVSDVTNFTGGEDLR